MGISPFSSSSYDCIPPKGNPNPSRYEIIHADRIGDYLILQIKYPDCHNFEGVKILVYLGVTLEQLKEQKQIDPHFSEDPKYISPIARFMPTPAGLALARMFAFHQGLEELKRKHPVTI